MAGQQDTLQSNACCGTPEQTQVSCSCPPCELKTYLTGEEEDILNDIRRVRREADMLRASPARADGNDCEARTWELRREWKALREKLEDATERKLIALGHREPRY